MASGAVSGWISHHSPRAQTSTRPHRRVLGDFGCEVGPDAAIAQDPNAAAETATIVLRDGTEMHTTNASAKRIVPEAVATLGLLPWGQYGCWRRYTDIAPCGLRGGCEIRLRTARRYMGLDATEFIPHVRDKQSANSSRLGQGVACNLCWHRLLLLFL